MPRYFRSIIFATSLLFGISATAIERPKVNVASRVDSRLMSLVRTVGSSEKQEPGSDPLSLSALYYLSAAYEETDYYTTGNYDKTTKDFDASVYINELPGKLLSNFSMPANGRITSGFGLRQTGRRMHKGVDISLRRGDRVCAAFDGTVARVGYEKDGYGYFIVLEHTDGFQSRYAHLQRPLVKPGDQICSGDQIALGGSTGNCTGPHLHFEIRYNRTPVDPTPLIPRR